ncbi:MAG: nicotinate phosphoribosyltransferase [Deltaproteobacteria bacterium]|nr:nicotinate phosphoribosyltransferase [Deltaproteobacteria bacterium]
MFYIANEDDIRNGRVMDVYFERASQILKAKGLSKYVAMEIRTKGLPAGWEWAIFSGLEEILELLKGKPVDVRAIPEGTLFAPYDPVMEIQGNYTDFGSYETEILGLMCQASGIATNSARIKLAAGFKPVFSFGARRMHPAIAPMIERSAYIGGCDGVSVVLDAEKIGIEPSGTIPHAFILLVGDTVKSAVYFDEMIDKEVPRLILIDTFNDEKFEAINVAEALKDRLYGIRLDTPGSRRGNMAQIVKETKWELDLRGHKGVKVMVSGGLDENKVKELEEFVDLFGIGTYISNSPVVDFAMDIVEIEHRPFAKRGKESGRKTLSRCKECGLRTVSAYPANTAACRACGGGLEEIMRPVMKNGRIVADLPPAGRIRDHVLNEIKKNSVKEKR